MPKPDPRLPNDDTHHVASLTSADRLRVALEIGIAALILVAIYYLFAPEEEIELAPPQQENATIPVSPNQPESVIKQQPPNLQGSVSPTTTLPADTPPLQKMHDEKSESDATSGIEGGSARELISRLRSGEIAFDPEQILKQISHHKKAGRLTDAYLLLFYAAREGDASAAFSLATMHDPNHFTTGNPLLEKPDAFQAHKWYITAADKGVTEAEVRLRALRKSVEELAQRGDSAAMRLLLNWQ